MSDAPESLHKLLDEITKKQLGSEPCDVTIEPISTGGANYTSQLYKIRITRTGKKMALFAKVATIGEGLRNDVPITQFYETERFVYETLEPIYYRLQEQSQVGASRRLYFPEFYGSNPKLYEETIVLEDLAEKGFTTHDRLKSIDWKYASAAVKELAKFHALSFAYELDDPEEYAEVLKQRTYEIKGDQKSIQLVWERMVGNVLENTREENRARLKKYLTAQGLRMRDYYKPLKKAVLTHGDYRPSNLMHKIDEEGNYEIVPVDYQTVRTGSVVTDLFYLMYTGTDAAFRKEHMEDLILEYYRQLEEALRRLNIDIEDVYSRHTYDAELEECQPYGLTVAIFVLPIVTVEASEAPNLGEMDLATWHVKTSHLFPERLNEIVDEYVAMGIV